MRRLCTQAHKIKNFGLSAIAGSPVFTEDGDFMDITGELFALADQKYRDFHMRLIPTVEPELIIGIRTPQLRRFASQLDAGTAAEFMAALPHKYYEENNLHAFLIEKIRDFDDAIRRTEEFVPYIDNWATCDCFSPKIFAKDPNRFLSHIDAWLKSGRPYSVRLGIGMLMRHYLGENFRPEYMRRAAKCACEEYYVNMMIAWYFATALAKRYDDALMYLTERRLPEWIHNKTISKACDSYRIDAQTKAYLKTLRIKKDA